MNDIRANGWGKKEWTVKEWNNCEKTKWMRERINRVWKGWKEWMIKVKKWEKKRVKQWGKSERMKERIKKEHKKFITKYWENEERSKRMITIQKQIQSKQKYEKENHERAKQQTLFRFNRVTDLDFCWIYSLIHRCTWSVRVIPRATSAVTHGLRLLRFLSPQMMIPLRTVPSKHSSSH